MSQMEEKLHVFEEEVLEEANRKKTEIEQAFEQEKRDRIAQKENEILTKAYQTIQRELGKIRREQNEVLSKAASDSKRELLGCRNRIIDSVFQQLYGRIESYRKTGEYKMFLKECAQQGLQEVGNGDVVVLLDERDMVFKETLAPLGIPVEQDTMELLGGCRVLNRSSSLMSDNSLVKRIEEEKERFLEEAGFRIQSL